jgi:hypothetical protein
MERTWSCQISTSERVLLLMLYEYMSGWPSTAVPLTVDT